MTARDEVLARIRSALGSTEAVPDVPRDYSRAGNLSGEPLLELLTERLVDYKAAVHRTNAAELPAVLPPLVEGRVLVPAGLPADWASFDWTVDTGFSPSELDGFDTVVTACTGACAETGTLVLDGSPDQGRRAISLVPDRHVCVVRSDQVVATVPELLARLDPLRPLTFISGPSATSDIELQRVEGVHGPRTLIVVMVTS
jgi:L-lactate dehydrogenase complex protein LldG